MERPTLHDSEALAQFRRQRRLDPDRLRRSLFALYQLHEPIDEALCRLSFADAAALRSEFDLEPLSIMSVHDSTIDWSSKFVLRTASGHVLETVLLRASTGRTSVCVSTQVGCRAGCPFCATARMGLERNLSSAEILEQVLIAARAARRERRRLRNVVFMGMGEPLENEPALFDALAVLLDKRGCAIPGKRITVSTVGMPAAMIRMADRFPEVRLALSLHSAREELRLKLVPWSRKHSWTELRDALRYVAARHEARRPAVPVMVEHIMLGGINDAPDDAEALVEYLRGIRAHVNLIPFNPIPHAPHWRPTERNRRDEFAARLRRAGIFTTIRYSMGADIQAACGQLALRNR
jgi:23S rRNA (adenine2503-C2)-methyltransferase